MLGGRKSEKGRGEGKIGEAKKGRRKREGEWEIKKERRKRGEKERGKRELEDLSQNK